LAQLGTQEAPLKRRHDAVSSNDDEVDAMQAKPHSSELLSMASSSFLPGNISVDYPASSTHVEANAALGIDPALPGDLFRLTPTGSASWMSLGEAAANDSGGYDLQASFMAAAAQSSLSPEPSSGDFATAMWSSALPSFQ
jgi:hypothetical protein